MGSIEDGEPSAGDGVGDQSELGPKDACTAWAQGSVGGSRVHGSLEQPPAPGREQEALVTGSGPLWSPWPNSDSTRKAEMQGSVGGVLRIYGLDPPSEVISMGPGRSRQAAAVQAQGTIS